MSNLFVTPWTVACQAPLSIWIPRQEYWCACVLSHFNCVLSFATLWSPPGSPVHRFSRQEYWNGVPCPPPGDLPNSGIKPVALMSPALASIFLTTSAPWEIRCLLEFTQIQVLWLVVLSNQLIFRCPSALPCFVELCREHAIYKSRCVATMYGAGR